MLLGLQASVLERKALYTELVNALEPLRLRAILVVTNRKPWRKQLCCSFFAPSPN